MSLLILGRSGESKVITNLGDEVEIRVVQIEPDRVLLDVSTRGRSYEACDLPAFIKKQAD